MRGGLQGCLEKRGAAEQAEQLTLLDWRSSVMNQDGTYYLKLGAATCRHTPSASARHRVNEPPSTHSNPPHRPHEWLPPSPGGDIYRRRHSPCCSTTPRPPPIITIARN